MSDRLAPPNEALGVSLGWRSLAHEVRANLPEPIWRALVCVSPPGSAEERLLRWVADRAVLDALGRASPVESGRPPDVIVADARAWFREPNEWRDTLLDLAGLDGPYLRALVLKEVDRLEREHGVIAAPVKRSTGEHAADMPGATFDAIKPQSRPYEVVRVRRRLSRADREQMNVIRAYVAKESGP